MTMKTLDDLIVESPTFAGLDRDELELIAGCARTAQFAADERLFREGDPAQTFFLVRSGRIALDVFVPHRGPVSIETADEGDVLGWSWLFPPYRWHFDARAVGPVRALAFDAVCLRKKCDEDPVLGYDLMSRFAQLAIDRLDATRLRLIDVYGRDGE
jgi:CRP/FNR family transcriptional regulator, cyclic AMP receptor protein